MKDFLFSVCSLLREMIPDVLGVLIGGMLTLRVTEVINTNLLKKEHELEILQKIKSLLREWSITLTTNVTSNLAIANIDEFKVTPYSEELRMLIGYFDLNMSVLSSFEEDFRRIRNLELSLQFKQKKYKTQLADVKDEKDQDDDTYFFENPERIEVLNKYAEEVHNITEEVNKLIVSLDDYISNEILNV